MRTFKLFYAVAATIVAIALILFNPLTGRAGEGKVRRCSSVSTGSRAYNAGTNECVDGNDNCNPEDGLAEPEVSTIPLSTHSFAASWAQLTLRPNACARLTLTSPIRWISSALWVDESNQILLIDPRADLLLQVAPDGRVSRLGAQPTYSSETYPVFLGRLENSLLLVLNELRAREISSQGVSHSELGHLRAGDGRGLGTFDEMTAYRNDLLAIGSYYPPGSTRFTRGFIYARIDDNPIAARQVRLILSLENDDYYLLGHQYLTSSDLGIFFLQMDQALRLWWYHPGDLHAKSLDLVPSPFASAPRFQTKVSGPRDLEARYREIEGLSIPVGIYGQGAFVYLLTRQPAAEGTLWMIYKLDPVAERVVGRVKLPTSAHHLTVVPSPQRWYFLEKSEVGAYGAQETPSMLAVPSAWITNPDTSPIGGERSAENLCTGARARPQGSTSESAEAPFVLARTPSLCPNLGLSGLFGRGR